jgi:hypothetical protein
MANPAGDYVIGTELEPFTFVANVSDKVKVQAGLAVAQTVKFDAGVGVTAQTVVDAINAGTDGCTASIDAGYIKIQANDEGATLLLWEVPGDAYEVLGFATIEVFTNPYPGLRQDQINRAAAGLERGWYLIAGDVIQYVSPAGNTTGLVCIMYDDERESQPGLAVDVAGIRPKSERELVFHKAYLAARNVVLDPAGYFVIDGKRWDFTKNEQIKEAQVPIGGIQSLIVVRVRCAVELNQSAEDAEFGWSDPSN